jgi:hypothetical protein
MRMTVVTDGKGKLIASMFEDPFLKPSQNGPSATLKPGPGQVFDELEVPDEYGELSPNDLHRELLKHLPRGPKGEEMSAP